MTTETDFLLALIVVGYLLGSIPFGLLVGKANGIDPRTAGSGNIGATNLGRLLGRKFFWIVFALDAAKSCVPMILGAIFVHHFHRDGLIRWPIYLLWVGAGTAAVVGHMFSIFMRFKGGKGVATSAGVILGLFPYFTIPSAVAMGTFAIVFRLWRYVSLASILAVLAFPVGYVSIGLVNGWDIFGQQLPLLAFSIIVPLLIVYRHRTNISRLIKGTENRSPRKNSAHVATVPEN